MDKMRPSLWKSSIILFILSIDVKNSLVAAMPRYVHLWLLLFFPCPSGAPG
jgi:hypothetical protein